MSDEERLGSSAEWIAEDGSSHERLELRWEAGGWTADGVINGLDLQYVLRLDPFWKVRQFMLFRDLSDPDLWLASDGGGRWGEMNGAHRPDLDGCIDIDLDCTPFTKSVPIRRLGLHVGHAAEVLVAVIDPETLQVAPVRHRYARLTERRWRHCVDGISVTEFEVDETDLVAHHPGRFRRVG